MHTSKKYRGSFHLTSRVQATSVHPSPQELGWIAATKPPSHRCWSRHCRWSHLGVHSASPSAPQVMAKRQPQHLRDIPKQGISGATTSHAQGLCRIFRYIFSRWEIKSSDKLSLSQSSPCSAQSRPSHQQLLGFLPGRSVFKGTEGGIESAHVRPANQWARKSCQQM